MRILLNLLHLKFWNLLNLSSQELKFKNTKGILNSVHVVSILKDQIIGEKSLAHS